MDFDTRGAFKSILNGITENNIQPCNISLIGDVLFCCIFPLGDNLNVEFNYHNEEKEGCVLLTYKNSIFDFCIQVGDFSDEDTPFASSDMITKKEVYDFVMSYKNHVCFDITAERLLLANMLNHATNYLMSSERAKLYEKRPAQREEDRKTIRRFCSYVEQRTATLKQKQLEE